MVFSKKLSSSLRLYSMGLVITGDPQETKETFKRKKQSV